MSSLRVETIGRQTNIPSGDGLATHAAPGVRNLEQWLQLEPATEPALLIPEQNTSAVDLRAATGKPLPTVQEQLVLKAGLEASNSALAALASRMAISQVTGCWVDVDAWRDDKGYTFTRQPESVGFNMPNRPRWPGVRLHTIAHLLFMRIRDPGYQKPENIDLDHMCCFPGCCNPHHTEGVTKEENNRRQRIAARIARPLMQGQAMVGPTYVEWLDNAVSDAPDEDTGLIVNTSDGPFRVVKLEDDPPIIRAEPERDDLLLALRPKSARRSPRPSRAKQKMPLKAQEPLFHKNKYTKKKLPTQKDLYRIAFAD